MTSMIKVDEIQNNTGTTTLAKIENGQLTGVLSPATGFRNRIINGDMRIDQRNAGASVTPASSSYTLDRWLANMNAGLSKYSVQKSNVSPIGFTNSLVVTSNSAYTLVASDYSTIQQRIEAFNMADIGWGSIKAQPLVLSFLVQSSLTGTFGGSLFVPYSLARTYPYSYTITEANTWEYKTILVDADAFTNTAPIDNNLYVLINWALGAGSTFTTGTTGWQNGNFASPTGCVNVLGTNGATWQITGVQLEKGTVATPFEFRSIGQELGLCQRYYYEDAPICGVGLGTGSVARATALHPVEMRASPSVTISNSVLFFNGSATITATGASTNYSNKRMFNADVTLFSGGVTSAASCRVAGAGKITVSSEL